MFWRWRWLAWGSWLRSYKDDLVWNGRLKIFGVVGIATSLVFHEGVFCYDVSAQGTGRAPYNELRYGWIFTVVLDSFNSCILLSRFIPGSIDRVLYYVQRVICTEEWHHPKHPDYFGPGVNDLWL